jgi:serine/threonine protein kinase/Tfp pilus assembly protein PilF
VTAERWEKVDRVYHAALERAAGERDIFLEEACAGDEELLREVQSLLAYEAASARFLERPALEHVADAIARDAGGSLAGRRIAGFEVLSLLGAGGMGEVYRAREVRLDREVALKVLPADVALDPEYARRFEEEARSASGLNHPNIVTIYGVGEEGDVAYIAMELVEGRTLRELLSGGALSVKAALDVAVPLAEAIAAAHARGIVHRDLKPENVMVTPEGHVKVLDFGIAKSARGGAPATPPETAVASPPGGTEAGSLLGTVGYMSPEQAAGRPAGPASDQFSFGLIVYEMLAGQSAFVRDTRTATLEAIRGEAPPPIHDVNPAVSPRLRAVIERCLARDPADRYPHAREVAAELRRIREEQTRSEARTRLTRRQAVVLGIGVVIAAGIGIAWWRLRPRIPVIRSIAVLPFANPLQDGEVEYLCEGISESLIRGFSRVPSLSVKPRSVISNLKGKAMDPREAGRRLSADVVVAGSVLRRSGRIEVAAELVSVATGIRLWSHTYDRAAGDALGTLNEITTAIVDDGIRLGLTGEDRRQLRGPTANATAYELYLRAIHSWAAESEAGYLEARGLLQEALALDPTFALGYGALATTHAIMAVDGYENPARAWANVTRLVRRALDLDPDLPDAHSEAASALFYHQWDWAGAERAWMRALQSTGGGFLPDFLSSRALQRWAVGRTDEALEFVRRARELDPLSPLFILKEADLLLHDGQLDPAAKLYESVIGIDREEARAYFGLAEVRRAQGRFDEAIDSLRPVLAASDDSLREKLESARGAEGYRRIEQAMAERELAHLRQRLAEGGYTSPLDLARAHARLGDRERVFALFDAAFEERSPGLVFLNVDRAWDAVRDDPRFLAAVRRVGLPG